jgi:hypothetical protein
MGKALDVLHEQLYYVQKELELIRQELDRTDSIDAHTYLLRERLREFKAREDQLLKLKSAIEGL